MKRVIFITGTDTGVGKTVLTALLLMHLRQRKINALALKPFCSGGREDVKLLQGIQPGELADNEVNPYFFPEPVAPIASKNKKRGLSVEKIVKKIDKIAENTDVLLVEGAGGVMVPITPRIFIADIIAALSCEVLLIARNQLGTLNHTSLSIECLEKRGVKKLKIILVDPAKKDVSSRSNKRILRSLFPRHEIFSIPHSSKTPNKIGHLAGFAKKNKKTLARLMVDH